MRITEEDLTFAPYQVLDARRVLAGLREFTARVHADAYSIPSVAIELGVPVTYHRDRSLEMIGACVRSDEGWVIQLNDAIDGTLHNMPGLIHELGHAIAQELAPRCRGELHQKRERDAWLRGIYVAISRHLVEGIEDGVLTERQVAGRCAVSLPIVKIRMALAVIMGEAGGDLVEAHSNIAEQLYALDEWFSDGRRDGFRDRVEA